MRNELQMIPTNPEETGPRGEEVGVGVPQWTRLTRKDDSTKKAALELDAAFATRRALGGWATYEISTDVVDTPTKAKPPVLPRPNSSFLHGFLPQQRNHETTKVEKKPLNFPPQKETRASSAPPPSCCFETPSEGVKKEGEVIKNEEGEGKEGEIVSGVDRGSTREERETAEEEESSFLRSPSPSKRISVARTFPVPPSAPSAKKPSFRVVRRRDSRRKETRRHHAMAVLQPGTKVATLASKFDALVLEKDASPARQKVSSARVQRSLSAQKSASMPRRRRAGEGDVLIVRKQGWRRRGDADLGGIRKGESELQLGSVSPSSGGGVTSSVKEAIKLFEGNSKARGPPIPRKPKRNESFAEGADIEREGMRSPETTEASPVEKPDEPADELEVIPSPPSTFSDMEDMTISIAKAVPAIVIAAPVEEEEEEENDGYEPVRVLEDKEDREATAPAVKPNSSFLWGTIPRPSAPLHRERSPDTERVLLPTPGYATVKGEKEEQKKEEMVEEEEGCYDDVGPPAEDEEGGYETFAEASSKGRSEEKEKEARRDEEEGCTYDDVPSSETLASRAETASVSDCYESIYFGRDTDGNVRGDGGVRGAVRGVAECGNASGEESRGGGSSDDSLSGIELKSNSLYGRCGSQLSDGDESEGRGPHEVFSYQLTSLAATKGHDNERKSETSDEWVDVDVSDPDEGNDEDSEGALPVYCERLCRGRRSPKWSKKVRREWSSRSRKSREALEMESDQHHYETLYELVGEMGRLERQETCTILVEEKSVSSKPHQTTQRHALPYENLSDDDDFDSFDSDATEDLDDQVPTKELPRIPTETCKVNNSNGDPLPGANPNGITKKMAEVAGKKMQEFRKNWSIRKHDISKSIQKIRKKSGGEIAVPGNPPCHPQPPLPPTPDAAPALPPARNSTTYAPARVPSMPPPAIPPSLPPSVPLNKSVSSGSLSGRKYWSFKSRFGRRESVSTSALQKQSSSSPSTSPSSSTFYLTETLDIDDSSSVSGNTKTLERSTGSSVRWSVSGENVIKRPNVSEKHKTNASKPPVNRRLSIRPLGPPPPPPNVQNSSHNVSQNGDTRNTGASPLSNASPTYAPPSSASSSSSSSSPYGMHRNRSSPTTSWYIDTDIGFHRAGSLDESIKKSNRVNKNSTTMWFADFGFWTSKNLQNAQDNGRSTDASDSSSSTIASPEGSLIHGQFTDEPLYQFYAASVAERITRDISQDFDSDGYEEIRVSKLDSQPSPRPKAIDLIHHKEGCRTLWCQIPEVVGSGLLDTFNSHQRKIQEAKFEVVTSEASYFKSLNILVSHFVESQIFKDETLLSKSDREILFSNVLPVKQCSEKFLADLERCWQEDILLLDICEIIRRHAERHFNVYISYCSNQVHLDRALNRLKKSSQFMEAIATLESHPICQSLSLHSFLMLPMQRVTRLPLLVDAILRRLPKDDSKYGDCQVALATLNKVVQECNEGAREAERVEEMKLLSKQLDFREVGFPPPLTGSRWLVRKGELTHLHWRDDTSSLLGVASVGAASSVSSIANAPPSSSASISTSKLTFGRKVMKQSLFLFLFTDLLVITKKKSEDHFLVLDFCPRNLVAIDGVGLDGSNIQQLPNKYLSESGKNIFLLSMLQNRDSKTVEMVLSASQESEKERWLEAFTPAYCESLQGEKVYEEWDCPQVAAIHKYIGQQPDELSLEPSDIVNVLRKLPDGWYLGERIRDREKGWFPANHCSEIVSSHIRAKNLRLRYRLLALSGDYLVQQRKERQSAKAAAKKKKAKKESKKE